MKRYHEFAVVKDGNKRVGFLLMDAPLGSFSDVIYVTEAEFAELVRQGQVQYFKPDSDGMYHVAYNIEERAYLEGNKLGDQMYTGKEYYRRDLNMQYRYLEKAMCGQGTYACFGLAQSGGRGVVLLTAFVFGNIGGIWDLAVQYMAQNPVYRIMTPMFQKAGKFYNNVASIMLPMEVWLKLAQLDGMAFNTYSLKITAEQFKESKNRKAKKIAKNMVSESEMEDIIAELERVG